MTGRVLLGLLYFVVAVVAGRFFAEGIELFNQLWGFESTLTQDWILGTILAALVMFPIVAAAGRPTTLSPRYWRERRAEQDAEHEMNLPTQLHSSVDDAHSERKLEARCNTCFSEFPIDNVDLENPKCPSCRDGYIQIRPRSSS